MGAADFTPQMQPNSQHQMWSQWTFVVKSDRKLPGKKECQENFRKWVELGFQTKIGRGLIRFLGGRRIRFVVQIEGPPAHDPEYREAVRSQFTEHFVSRGFGSGAVLEHFEVSILAGDSQDGKPPSQLIVLPLLDLKSLLQR